MAKTLLERIDWPKFSNLIIAKIGAMRLAAEKFPDGPAKAQFPAELTVTLHGVGGNRIGEG